jgi:hypothetical protein
MPLRRAESLQAGRSIAGELPYWWVFGVDTVGLDSAMNPLDLNMRCRPQAGGVSTGLPGGSPLDACLHECVREG